MHLFGFLITINNKLLLIYIFFVLLFRVTVFHWHLWCWAWTKINWYMMELQVTQNPNCERNDFYSTAFYSVRCLWADGHKCCVSYCYQVSPRMLSKRYTWEMYYKQVKDKHQQDKPSLVQVIIIAQPYKNEHFIFDMGFGKISLTVYSWLQTLCMYYCCSTIPLCNMSVYHSLAGLFCFSTSSPRYTLFLSRLSQHLAWYNWIVV